MSNYQIVAIHGFLGDATDWNGVQEAFQKLNIDHIQVEWLKVNLFLSQRDHLQIKDLSSFEKVSNYIHSLTDSNKKKILLGYSMGGRIALHILKNFSDQYDFCVLLSTHSGLTNEADRFRRIEHDLSWKKKLFELSWNNFIQEWINQPVFKNDNKLYRNQTTYDLQRLACGLDQLSLGRQDDMVQVIFKNQSKIKWLVGEFDEKFIDVAHSLKQKKILSDYERILSSGHRILFDNPELVAKSIYQVILQQP